MKSNPIEDIRNRLGMTRATFATAMECSPAWIHQIENGVPPRLSMPFLDRLQSLMVLKGETDVDPWAIGKAYEKHAATVRQRIIAS